MTFGTLSNNLPICSMILVGSLFLKEFVQLSDYFCIGADRSLCLKRQKHCLGY